MRSRRAFFAPHAALGCRHACGPGPGLGPALVPPAEAIPASKYVYSGTAPVPGLVSGSTSTRHDALMQEVRLRTSVETRDERQVLTLARSSPVCLPVSVYDRRTWF